MGNKIKVGAEMYSACIAGRSAYLSLYVVTVIRKGKVHLVRKNSSTWVKKSKKHYDYGWAKRIDSWDRETFDLEGGLPEDYSWTKAAAYRKAIAEVRKDAKREVETLQKALKRLLTNATKLKDKQARKKEILQKMEDGWNE